MPCLPFGTHALLSRHTVQEYTFTKKIRLAKPGPGSVIPREIGSGPVDFSYSYIFS